MWVNDVIREINLDDDLIIQLTKSIGISILIK